MGSTVADIREMLREADAEEFAALERSLSADGRKGVKDALEVARRRLAGEAAEAQRLAGLYSFDASLAGDRPGGVLVGLDEVGRGAVAGPLAVGAVVLPSEPHIEGLNDSKQLSPEQRESVANRIREIALCWKVCFVEAAEIDALGMSAALRKAFSGALGQVEREGFSATVVLVDGNPLGIDARERNVVKGDSKSAAIAAASIIAKVTRDAFMVSLDSTYPQYGFCTNKGYGAPDHISAIRDHGLTPAHRASFCKSFMQPTLF